MNPVEKILKRNHIYTTKEAAKLLGIPEDTLQKQIKAGRHNAFKIGTGNRSFYLIILRPDEIKKKEGEQSD